MVNSTTDGEFVFWSILNNAGGSLKTRIANSWQALLNNEKTPEESYQSFLHENASWFFLDGINRLVVLSKIRLGANWITDFVSTYTQLSYGFNYELIEIESPHCAPFTKAGNPSMRLVRAVQQVHSWKQWIEANRDEAKRLFPSTLFSSHDSASFRFTIYIGTRENSKRWIEQRNHYSKELGIEIRSFDALTEHLKRRPVLDFWIGGDETGDRLSLLVRNQLMNPFAKAYPDKVWRRMVSDPSFRLFHMITTNADLLLQNREYSKSYSAFMRYWNRVPKKIKDLYADQTMKYRDL